MKPTCNNCKNFNVSLICESCIHNSPKTDNFVLKEKPKHPLDLSHVVNTNVLCEFSEPCMFISSMKHLGFLKQIGNDSVHGKFYDDHNGLHYSKCRILENHWMHHEGGVCPLPLGIEVDVLLKNDRIKSLTKVYDASWDHSLNPSQHAWYVQAFRVTGVHKDYTY